MSIDDSKQYIATIHTDKGQIVMELDALYAPQHVNNFVFLTKEGFFDGLTFHRYDPGFVIQGGDPLGVGTGGPGYRIPAEIGLLHEKGAVAMARQGDAMNPEKKSSGSQFYITLKATPFLDGDYSVFGKVVEGMDVVQQIRRGDVMTKVVVEEK
ncbi:peptidylprolyl isomerase [candidate division KSB1 bacterium]|nr:peptidylprolyl isomerase [candidate division KSB1 bacterium]